MQLQTAAGTAGANFTLPVALKGLHNWAALVGTMCNAASMDSTACLHEYFNHTSAMLDTLVSTSDALFSPVIPETRIKGKWPVEDNLWQLSTS